MKLVAALAVLCVLTAQAPAPTTLPEIGRTRSKGFCTTVRAQDGRGVFAHFARTHYMGSSSPLPARGLGTTLGFLSANCPSGLGTTHTGTS